MAKQAESKASHNPRDRDVRREYYIVKFTQLVADKKKNIRYNYGDLEVLAAALQAGKSEDGNTDIESPLVGRKIGGSLQYEVLDGFRRYYAMELIYKRTGVDMECKLMPVTKYWGEREMILGMFTFNAGKALEPLEKAYGIKRLVATGMAQADIARSLAVTESYITRLNKLNEAPEEAIALIKSGKVKAATIITQMSRKTLDTFLADVRGGKYDTTVGEADEYEQQELFEDVPGVAKQRSSDAKEVGAAGSPAQVNQPADRKPAKAKKKTVISQRDIDKKSEPEEPALSSWKELKKVVSAADIKVNAAKEGVYMFVLAVINNEIKEDKMKTFFKNKSWTL